MVQLKNKPTEFLPLLSPESFPDFEGSYYYNARWYDAGTGRFISEDPARDGSNWYSYTYNNPLKYIDPTGMTSEEDLDQMTKDAIADREKRREKMGYSGNDSGGNQGSKGPDDEGKSDDPTKEEEIPGAGETDPPIPGQEIPEDVINLLEEIIGLDLLDFDTYGDEVLYGGAEVTWDTVRLEINNLNTVGKVSVSAEAVGRLQMTSPTGATKTIDSGITKEVKVDIELSLIVEENGITSIKSSSIDGSVLANHQTKGLEMNYSNDQNLRGAYASASYHTNEGIIELEVGF